MCSTTIEKNCRCKENCSKEWITTTATTANDECEDEDEYGNETADDGIWNEYAVDDGDDSNDGNEYESNDATNDDTYGNATTSTIKTDD